MPKMISADLLTAETFRQNEFGALRGSFFFVASDLS